jgi:hypothetical protein
LTQHQKCNGEQIIKMIEIISANSADHE